MTTFRNVLRLLGRLTAVGVGFVLVAFVAMQYAQIIGKNVAVAHELSTVTSDVASLKAKRAEQRATIVRLSDPQGAIPEIHDRLRLAAPKEAIVYLKKTPAVGP